LFGCGYAAAVKLNESTAYWVEAGYRSQYGGFTAATGAKQAADVTTLDVEVEVMYDGLRAVLASDILNAQQG